MRSYKIVLASASAMAIMLLSTPASACRVSQSYWHADRSDLRGNFAAEVQVSQVFGSDEKIAFEALVVSILHGTLTHSTVQVRRSSRCAAVPAIGKRGVLMGCLGSGDEGTVITPFLQSGAYLLPHLRERFC